MARIRCALLLASSFLVCLPAQALNILLTNDDGFETANIRALYQRLKAAGHDVLLSAPAQNNSGRGGAIAFLQPIGPTAKASRYGAIAAGAPGIGQDPADANIYYVDGTPAMSVLYGLDVLAPRRWGRRPDLVISGPNEGNNLGAVVVSSGTVNNAFIALAYRVPALAVSYGDFGSRAHGQLTAEAVEYEVADLIARIVAQLQQHQPKAGPLLPSNVGININIPQFASGQGKALRYRFTHLGGFGSPAPWFFEQLSQSAYAKSVGLDSDLPGVSLITSTQSPPGGLAIPYETRPDAEAQVLPQGFITLSPIRMAPEGTSADDAVLRRKLQKLPR